ncbi:MAG: SpoIIE family protein phosphatase [Spirochaetes bacterium]|jgi:two-component system sensor histidine kinase ChiS|nr:SpoIIE family protein phosphatase [Spirochaetota bacterium]
MKLKFKLILAFTAIIITATLPLSVYILDKEEKERMDNIARHGQTVCRIISRSSMNILLMDSADVEQARIDARDIMTSLKPLADEGLLLGEAVLTTKNRELDGVVLASYVSPSQTAGTSGNRKKISGVELDRIKTAPPFREISLPGYGGVCLEFIYADRSPNRSFYCIGRLVYSREQALRSLKTIRRVIFSAVAIVIIASGLLGFFISRVISRPLSELTAGAERIESGDLDHRIHAAGSDEMGRLGATFNSMAEGLKRQFARLEVMNRELVRIDRLKDEFLANISHELRTPLQGIIGLAESMSQGAAGPVGEETSRNLALISSSGIRLSGLVDDILDFSRLTHGDVSILMVPVDMESVCSYAVSLLKPAAEKKSIGLALMIEPGSAPVIGEPGRLQQIMLNLVGNAVKFTDAGTVTISASAEPDGMTRISVIDTGTGIDPGTGSEMFDPFVQADGSASRRYGGVGLGLAITRNLVNLHGGRIWFEPGPGGGTAFHFTLRSHENGSAVSTYGGPVGGKPAAAGPERHPAAKVRPRGPETGRIILVDDEPVNVQVMVNHLTLQGYGVETQTNGIGLLESIDRGPLPDLVILDVMLPGMSGYDICRIIRERHTRFELPVLMLTARKNPEDIAAGLDAGANDYVSKPVTGRELVSRVGNLVSLKNSVREHDTLVMIRQEMELAKEIQRTLIAPIPPEISGMEVSAIYRPMSAVGGDFYDIRPAGGPVAGILVSDITGHGIPAAYVSAMLQAVYSCYRETVQEPRELLKRINEIMCGYTHGQYATACSATIDAGEMKMHSSNAGHCPVLIWRMKDGSVTEVAGGGKPIGVAPGEEYPQSTLDLNEGDRIIFYTDCAVEAKNESGEMLGYGRFKEIIKKHARGTGGDFTGSVFGEILEWRGKKSGGVFNDDFTLIAVEMKKS